MIKVLHVLNTGKYSGAENVVITLINAMENVECAYASPDGPIRNILKDNHITFFPTTIHKMTAKELKRIIHEFNPDIIHAHDFNAGIMSVLTGASVPIINHLHNNTPWMKKLCIKSIGYLLVSIKFQKILTVSESVMKEYIFGKNLIDKSIVIGNPINTKVIKEKAMQAENHETSDLVFLGRLSPQKNPFFFLQLVAEIKKIKPDIKVAMVGTGELREKIETKCHELNIVNNVTLYGFQKNPYGLLNASKILCMPSEWEGFGLAAVEGMTLGKPVVAAPVGGLVNLIDDSCGKLCEKKEDYIKTIIKLLSDQQEYEKKAEGAKRRADELDNLALYVLKITEIYTDLLTGEV